MSIPEKSPDDFSSSISPSRHPWFRMLFTHFNPWSSIMSMVFSWYFLYRPSFPLFTQHFPWHQTLGIPGFPPLATPGGFHPRAPEAPRSCRRWRTSWPRCGRTSRRCWSGTSPRAPCARASWRLEDFVERNGNWGEPIEIDVVLSEKKSHHGLMKIKRGFNKQTFPLVDEKRVGV